MAVCLALTGKQYLDCALAAGEQTKNASRSVRPASSNRAVSPLRALMRLEWHDLLRTQSYLLNGVLGCLIMPIALVIGVFVGLGRTQVSSEEFSTGLAGTIGQMDSGLLIAILTGAFFLCTMVNQLPATAISREGRHYPFSLSLPVTQIERFGAKLLVSLTMNLLSMLILCIAILVIVPAPFHVVLIGFCLALILSVCPAAVSLALDARRPKLNWMTETEAMKNNFNSFFCIILWIASAAVVAIAVYFTASISQTAMMIAMIASILILCLTSLALLYRTAEKTRYLQD